eukprot:scaffold228_cov312-Pinguiococcus_pyrenoidosus.AAC.45
MQRCLEQGLEQQERRSARCLLRWAKQWQIRYALEDFLHVFRGRISPMPSALVDISAAHMNDHVHYRCSRSFEEDKTAKARGQATHRCEV